MPICVHYLSAVISLLVLSELVSGFHKFDINRLLEKLDPSQLNLTNVEEKWIEQPLDHFNPSETRILRMRYFENLELWQRNGPIFIFIGGEAEMRNFWISSSDVFLIAQMAKATSGALYATEHRYYGKSKPPIPDDNLTEYYQFLSSQQALSDLEKFIKMLKSKPEFAGSKVVVVSGSYPGNLVTWLRELYPELVDAAVAGSAPVLAKKDFHEYLDVVRYAITTYGTTNCLSNVEKTYKRYEELLKTTDGMETLRQELNICPNNDLTVQENQQFLFYRKYGDWMDAVQTAVAPIDIQNFCGKFEADTIKPDNSHTVLAEVDPSKNVGCFNVDLSSQIPTDAWTHQYCTEFGYLITTTSEKQPFVHWSPVEFNLKFCTKMINGDIENTLDKGIARTNKMYGGRSPRVSKVVFTHGDMDPWSALGVLRDLGPDAPVTIVNGTSHCGVLCVRPSEPEELKQNRELVKSLIYKWISTA